MTSLLIGSIFAILRAADGANAVTRGVVVACAALLLTIHNQQEWWMIFVQTVAVYAIFWGGWSSMLDWAQGLLLSEPKEHRIANWVWEKQGYFDASWVFARMFCGIFCVCAINGVWFLSVLLAIAMACCYWASFKWRGGSDWVRWAEYASWYLLGICLV